jgi:hypothetical protein
VRALAAAAQAMQSVASYRFTGNVVAGGQTLHLAGSFNAPDKVDETVAAGSAGSVRLVLLGSEVLELDPSTGKWNTAAGAPGGGADLRQAFVALAGAIKVTGAGSSYSFELDGAAAQSLVSGAAGPVTGTVTVQGARITNLAFRSATPPISVQLHYSGLGTAPRVTQPPAG